MKSHCLYCGNSAKLNSFGYCECCFDTEEITQKVIKEQLNRITNTNNLFTFSKSQTLEIAKKLHEIEEVINW
jgi:hypothetical protein